MFKLSTYNMFGNLTFNWEPRWSYSQLGGCAIVALGCGTLLHYHQVVARYMVIGPYASVLSNPIARALQRAIIDLTKDDVKVEWTPLDSLATQTPTRPSENGHAVSGATRDAARLLITNAINAGGFRKFEISPAPVTIDGGPMLNQHYAVGDLNTGVRNDLPEQGDVVVCIDTDYYLRDLDSVFGHPVPAIMHTFSPLTVAGLDGDAPFRIRNNYIEYDVGGGNRWTHRVWDWCGFGEFIEFTRPCATDILSLCKSSLIYLPILGVGRALLLGSKPQWYYMHVGLVAAHWGSNWIFHQTPEGTPETKKPGPGAYWSAVRYWLQRALGLRPVVYHKVVHARPWTNCPDRLLVWLLPQFTATRISWLPSDLRSRRVGRINFQDRSRAGWNSVVHNQDGKLMINFGREGEDATATLPKTDFDVLMGLDSAQSVTSRMIGMRHTDPCLLALVGQYFRAKLGIDIDPFRVGNSAKPKVHWPAHIEAEEPETSARTYSSPLISSENMLPMVKRWEVLSNSIDERVTFHVNKKVPSLRYHSYAAEFVRLVVPQQHAGVPLTLEEVRDEMDKPSQQLAATQVWETVDAPHRHLIESFVKNEPTSKAGRIISSFADTRYMLKLSRFTLALKTQALKQKHNEHWFLPGCTPLEITVKVREFFSCVASVAECDYSNMDGTVSEWMQRHIGLAIKLRHFPKDYHKELSDYYAMLIKCPARAKRFNFRYEAGPGVKSGSPTTTDDNTLYNAFCQYCAIRITYPDLTTEEAFALIGICFGDDGAMDRQYQRALVKVTEHFGMKIKIEPTDLSQGFCFLSRVYPDPLTTDTSFQDPLRTWRKLHITTRDPNIAIETAALDRLEGYLVTDSLSPVTSDYCRAIIRIVSTRPCESKEVRSKRKSADKEKPYWLTRGGAWPQSEDDVELMWQCTAARVGMTVEELRVISLKLADINDVWAVPTINKDFEPYVWKGTLAPCGQPVEDRVNQHKFDSDRNVQSTRAGGGISREDRTDKSMSSSADQQRQDYGRQEVEGPGGVHLRVASGDKKGSHDGRRPTAQTGTGGAAEGNPSTAINRKGLVRYVRGDLLDHAHKVIAHAISADQAMSQGVAKSICDVLGRDFVTAKEQPVVGTVNRHVVDTTKGQRVVYNLIAKEKKGDKPTPDAIKLCLKALAEEAQRNGDELVCFPRIFCGLDGQRWDEVEKQLETAFKGKKVQPQVVTPERKDPPRSPRPRKQGAKRFPAKNRGKNTKHSQ